MVLTPYSSHPIYRTRYQRIGTVWSQTDQHQLPVSSLIQERRLKLFGYIARAAASEDHSRALRTSTNLLPVDWRRPRARRPRQYWLRTIESDLKPLNLGLYSALWRATDRPSWRRIVEMAITCHLMMTMMMMMMMKPGCRSSFCSYRNGKYPAGENIRKECVQGKIGM